MTEIDRAKNVTVSLILGVVAFFIGCGWTEMQQSKTVVEYQLKIAQLTNELAQKKIDQCYVGQPGPVGDDGR